MSTTIPVYNSRSHRANHGEIPSHVQAKAARLVVLRTKDEAHAKLVLKPAYVVQVPIKSANEVVKCIDQAILCHGEDYLHLHHLRRFAKHDFLPQSLRGLIGSSTRELTSSCNSQLANESGSNSASDVQEKADHSDRVDSKTPTLIFLICAASSLSIEEVRNRLLSIRGFVGGQTVPDVHTILVPFTSPTSEEQAKNWSRDYWPTVYKKHNPNGPHPSIVSRAEDEIRPFVDQWMTLAQQASREAFDTNIGEGIGVVIVEPNDAGKPISVAVAGDARWKDDAPNGERRSGNIMAHATMRAIGMVAVKRQERPSPIEMMDTKSLIFCDYPLTASEKTAFSQNPIKPDGYLCTELEIYLTHEPCVMCTMAILHSRFAKVIFKRRMLTTGGLTAETTGNGSEGELGYGLFWLHELNWKLLAWQWIDETDGESSDSRLIHA